MIEQPLVSIICTVYNKAPWLEKTITSLLNQETDFPVEILLIDDASTDHSREIITSFQEQYPEQIRSFFNEENLGISKTWVKTCKEARGQYIARCDGDDFWLDNRKLQKQVELLASHPTAKWSNTDFDIYDEEGQLVAESGFENGWIPLADTFEKMLATRGFTMASTWLVERELMLEVNDELDLTTSDDTFNLQMDLFQRTQLAYLPEATVAYVINKGSDSRPKDFEKIEDRFNALLATQNDYLDKYPNSDYREMLRILLERNNRHELELTKKEAGLERRGIEKVTVYFDKGNKHFAQDNSLQYPLAMRDEIRIDLPENCHCIRVDLSESPSFYRLVQLISLATGTELLPSFSNGIEIGGAYFFPNPDPQLVYDIPQDLFGTSVSLSYQLYELNDVTATDYIATSLAQELLDVKFKQKEVYQNRMDQAKLLQKIDQQRQDLEEVTRLYNGVTHSRRWTIPTKIINFFRRNK